MLETNLKGFNLVTEANVFFLLCMGTTCASFLFEPLFLVGRSKVPATTTKKNYPLTIALHFTIFYERAFSSSRKRVSMTVIAGVSDSKKNP